MDPLILEPQQGVETLGTLIFLHGLGANGHDFEPVARQLMPQLPFRWVLPHAPTLPVTINNGWRMPAWYDITSLDRADGVDWNTVSDSRSFLHELLEAEASRNPRKLLVGGFSQGGAIALASSFDAPVAVDGVIALSTYLLRQAEESGLPATLDTDRVPSVFMAHGTEDQILPLELARQSAQVLRDAGINLEWHEYPMPHSVCPKELQDLAQWLLRLSM